MILRREVYDDDGHTIIEHAEVYDGDEFVDRYDNHCCISISDDEDPHALVKKVIGCEADDENIEVMMDWEIFLHFRNPNIVTLEQAFTEDRYFRIWAYRAWQPATIIERENAVRWKVYIQNVEEEWLVTKDTAVKLY